jgi:thiosulfate/3-mercaptopyruvate sulfurtransferase
VSANTTKLTANPDLLWSVDDLASHMDDPKLRIVDVRPGERFAMGHIGGARNFDVYALNCDDTDDAPLKSFVRMWAFLLGRRGVSPDDTLVFCGEVTGMSATRGFWFAEYLGHKNVHILDGGYTAWAAAGRPTTRDAAPASATPYRFDAQPQRLATYRDMLGAIDSDEAIIIDTRSRAEYLGTDVRAARGGAAPGAVHIEWLNHLNDDGTLKPRDALRDVFESHGVTPDKDIMAYCQTGYRSAHAYFALRVLGYPRVRNYLGSWNEWGNRDGMPIETPNPDPTDK